MRTKTKKKKTKASVLVYSLIIMFVILSVVLGITQVVVVKQKSASETSQSIQAFQIANSGIEKVLYIKNNNPPSTIQDLGDNPSNCSDGVVTYNIGGGIAKIYFYDINGSSLTSCSSLVSSIQYIKSVGEISGSKRAIQIDWN